MDTPSLAMITQTVAASGTVTATDVLALRRTIFADGVVSKTEADALFEIERSRKSHTPEWSMFFVEALADFLLNQDPPAGYISLENATWIEAQVKRRKQPSTDGDLALVTNIIERAREVPASFAAFALQLAKDAVIYGDGPDAQGRAHAHGKVTEADVVMLQRILWGAGSEGLLAISREEAEALFAIADATTGADNDPAFDELFAKAIGNYLLGATGRAVPPREVSLRWETEPSHKADIVGVLSQMFTRPMKGLGGMVAAARHASTLAQEVELEHAMRNVARDVDTEFNAILTPEKAAWLDERIARNGTTNGPERALLRFVERESAQLDPSLEAVIAKVA